MNEIGAWEVLFSERISPAFLILPQSRSAVFAFARAEEQGDAPDAGKGYECVDDTSDNGTLTAADPRNDIKFEQTDTSPVERTDNYKYERNSVKQHNKILLSSHSYVRKPYMMCERCTGRSYYNRFSVI